MDVVRARCVICDCLFQYLRSLGYCPQFFGLDEFLTGKQNLALLLTLRGLRTDDLSEEVNNWIQVVGMYFFLLILMILCHKSRHHLHVHNKSLRVGYSVGLLSYGLGCF